MEKVFKALNDPARRKILKLLAKRGPTNASELLKEFNFTKATLSHHLSVLKNADLIEARKEGRKIYFSLKTTVLEDLLIFLKDLLEREERK